MVHNFTAEDHYKMVPLNWLIKALLMKKSLPDIGIELQLYKTGVVCGKVGNCIENHCKIVCRPI